jgi:hypothetical protein
MCLVYSKGQVLGLEKWAEFSLESTQGTQKEHQFHELMMLVLVFRENPFDALIGDEPDCCYKDKYPV